MKIEDAKFMLRYTDITTDVMNDLNQQCDWDKIHFLRKECYFLASHYWKRRISIISYRIISYPWTTLFSVILSLRHYLLTCRSDAFIAISAKAATSTLAFCNGFRIVITATFCNGCNIDLSMGENEGKPSWKVLSAAFAEALLRFNGDHRSTREGDCIAVFNSARNSWSVRAMRRRDSKVDEDHTIEL